MFLKVRCCGESTLQSQSGRSVESGKQISDGLPDWRRRNGLSTAGSARAVVSFLTVRPWFTKLDGAFVEGTQWILQARKEYDMNSVPTPPTTPVLPGKLETLFHSELLPNARYRQW
jgi:hypothetical protein